MKRIVVLGAAESGVGAAILAQKEGFDVFVSDMSAIKDHYKAMLDSHGIEWEEGHHSEDKILNADEVIKSPGIPKEAPMIQKVMARNIPVISEIEFAGRYTDARMICITGSNGKTTTTSLIYHIMEKAGYDVGLAGNIGHSLALQVAEAPHAWYVIELSSFPLDNMYDFHPDIAEWSDFAAHREDQSLLSLLRDKWGLPAFRDPSDYGEMPFMYIGSGNWDYNPKQYPNSPYPTIILCNRKVHPLKYWLRYIIKHSLNRLGIYYTESNRLKKCKKQTEQP